MNHLEGQKSWGWMVVMYIFLAGLGGGTFIFSFVLNLLGKYTAVAQAGALIGPVLVLAGTVLLLFDLGSPLKSYRLFTTGYTITTSWMIRGSWILAAFIIMGLLYALPSFNLFMWLPWNSGTSAGMVIGWVAALLAVFVTVYPGLLLGVIKSIPLWNTAALPPLFFLSGLDTGLAAIVLMSLAFPSAAGMEAFHLMGLIDIILILLVLIVLGTYIEILRQSGIAAAASVHLLKTPVFIVGVVILGLLIPLCLLITAYLIQDIRAIKVLDGIAGILILCGGLLLRLNIVKSGVRIAVV